MLRGTFHHLDAQSACDRLLATLDSLEEAIVGRLLLQVLIPQQSGTLAGKDTRDPGEGVGDTPDGHTDTPLNGKAALCDGLVSLGLGLELLGGGGSIHADVDLGVDNVNVQAGEATEDGLKDGLAGQGAGGGGGLLGKVSLYAC